ncbi:MAG TPA: hypothetical protein VNU01_03205 [Egibacteraceae bacterium]|nr:hypothetical protein [Egibacteraceae bacterium]
MVRITPADTGSRVSVRRRIPHEQGQPSMTDVVGVLESWSDGVLRIRTKRGELVDVDEPSLVAGRIISVGFPQTGGE